MQKSTFPWKAYYMITGLGGIILLVFEIGLYRNTIISAITPIIIILVAGFAGFMLSKNNYSEVYATKGFFFPLVQNIVSWGFAACYLFMAANYYMASATSKDYKFKIIEKNWLPGGKGARSKTEPTASINYFDTEKQLVFTHDQTEKVNTADSVFVTAKKGLFGYDILTHYDLVK